MSDLISRQAAIDAIKEQIFARVDWLSDSRMERKGLDAALCVIEDLPSAQAEIIRCKDCENWDTSWQNDYAPNYHYCPLVDGTRRDDFYCADAERRTDETD